MENKEYGSIFQEPTVFADMPTDEKSTQYEGEGYTIPEVAEDATAANVDDASVTDKLHQTLSVETNDYLVEAYEETWASRDEISSVAAVIAEEMLIRALEELFPEGVLEVHLYEDKTHGSPHGHVLRVIDVNGETIVEGTSEVWHDTSGTSEIDELASEIYQLVPTCFSYDKEENARMHVIPVERDLRTKHADSFSNSYNDK